MPPEFKRPVSVTIVGLLFIATGVGGAILHANEMVNRHPFQRDALWAFLVSLVALACGSYILLRRNWARWLAVAWLVFHVVLSAFHSRRELLIHVVLFLLLTYVLFRAAASVYFRVTTPAD